MGQNGTVGIGKVAESVDESWAVITGYVRRYAPRHLDKLRPGATPEALRLVEQAVGGPLPADLARWWQLANGSDVGFFLVPQSFAPNSTTGALSSRESWLKVAADMLPDASVVSARCALEPAGTAVEGAWLPQWLPIAEESQRSLMVDLRRGPAHGCVGEVGVGFTLTSPRWPSTAAMLAAVAEAIRRDIPIDGFHIWADENRLKWDTAVWRWVYPGGEEVELDDVRRGYAELIAELRAGGFGPPQDGRWPAEWVAAHVRRNTELLLATNEAIVAAGPDWGHRMAAAMREERSHRASRIRFRSDVTPRICYDNSYSMDPVILERDAARGLSALIQDIESTSARLAASVERLHGRWPKAYVRILDGTVLVDEEIVSWWSVLWALHMRQLPIRIRQLQDLRCAPID
jgi:cell wall assembly regulator SMI1